MSGSLSGVKILEEVQSPINGKITVVKTLGFGTYIQVEGLTQSGGVVYGVWRTTLRKIRNTKSKIQNCLVLGLGGGSAAGLVKKFWPEAEITGVEIDPIMVDLGKKYLGLKELKINRACHFVIEDVHKYCIEAKDRGKKFDLILVDMYVGYEVPKKFETENFIELVKSIITEGGIIVFNRLYFDEKRKKAKIFHRKLIHTFKKVRPIYPEANVMFVCSDSDKMNGC
ncbi:MAG: hypothetical protein WBD86_02025 [Microgenomates group bacterium]